MKNICRLLVLAIAIGPAQAQTATRPDIASEPLTEKQVFSGADSQTEAEAFRATVVDRYGLEPVPAERSADADAIKRLLLSSLMNEGNCDAVAGTCRSDAALALCLTWPQDPATFGKQIHCVGIGPGTPPGSAAAFDTLGIRFSGAAQADAFVSVAVRGGAGAPLEYNVWRVDMDRAGEKWNVTELWYLHNRDRQMFAPPPATYRHTY